MSERYVKITSEEEIPFEFKGVVSFQITDGNIEAVILETEGALLRIVKGGAYSDTLKILQKAPKVKVTKYKLQGSIYGVPIIPEVFVDESDAQEEKNKIERNGHYSEEIKLEVVPVDEFVDEVKL